MKEFNKCKNFLLKNGWEIDDSEFLLTDGMDDIAFHKHGCYSVDLGPDEMTFIGEIGDFFSCQTNYYTLVGLFIDHRQINASYISIRGHNDEPPHKKKG